MQCKPEMITDKNMVLKNEENTLEFAINKIQMPINVDMTELSIGPDVRIITAFVRALRPEPSDNMKDEQTNVQKFTENPTEIVRYTMVTELIGNAQNDIYPITPIIIDARDKATIKTNST